MHDVEAGVGEFGEGVAAVGGGGCPYDPAAPLTALDDVVQTGERPAGEEGELSHHQPRPRSLLLLIEPAQLLVAHVVRAPIWTETGVTVLGLAAMRVKIRVTAVVGSGS
ncbi:hypothetical protein [Streptomyces sp. KL118A]|uniref:hypothetical protein n=1 Tax=Streptomyces sp. KL118A TaxID=3045153 RepID=UPI00353190AD